jgi:hypothetical protein
MRRRKTARPSTVDLPPATDPRATPLDALGRQRITFALDALQAGTILWPLPTEAQHWLAKCLVLWAAAQDSPPAAHTRAVTEWWIDRMLLGQPDPTAVVAAAAEVAEHEAMDHA